MKNFLFCEVNMEIYFSKPLYYSIFFSLRSATLMPLSVDVHLSLSTITRDINLIIYSGQIKSLKFYLMKNVSIIKCYLANLNELHLFIWSFSNPNIFPKHIMHRVTLYNFKSGAVVGGEK